MYTTSKTQQKTVSLSKPSVRSQQIAVGLSEQPVVKSQKTVALKKLLNEPSKTALRLSANAHSDMVTIDESCNKVSETRKHAFLPPWTSKRESLSQQFTSKNHHFSPKVRGRKCTQRRCSLDFCDVMFPRRLLSLAGCH